MDKIYWTYANLELTKIEKIELEKRDKDNDANKFAFSHALAIIRRHFS